MRPSDNVCKADWLGFDALSSFTLNTIAGLLIFTAAIAVGGFFVGLVERILSGNCRCLWLCRLLRRGRGAGGVDADADADATADADAGGPARVAMGEGEEAGAVGGGVEGEGKVEKGAGGKAEKAEPPTEEALGRARTERIQEVRRVWRVCSSIAGRPLELAPGRQFHDTSRRLRSQFR